MKIKNIKSVLGEKSLKSHGQHSTDFSPTFFRTLEITSIKISHKVLPNAKNPIDVGCFL